MKAKNALFVCLVLALSVIGLCLCGVLFMQNSTAYAQDNWYDNDSVEIVQPQNPQINGVLKSTEYIDCVLDSKSYGFKKIDSILLENTSTTESVMVNSISLQPLIASSDIGTVIVKDADSGTIYLQGNIGDSKTCSVSIDPQKSKKLIVDIQDPQGKAYKYANTTPAKFNFSYDTLKRTAKAVLYPNGNISEDQLVSKKLTNNTEGAVNATGKLVFYYDAKDYSTVGTVYQITDGTRTWAAAAPYTATVVFDASFRDFRTKTLENWFSGFSSLKTIEYMESYLITTNVVKMDYMFNDCRKLEKVRVYNFDTSNVVSTSSMFWNCDSLTSISVGSWNTSKIVNMSRMFGSWVDESPYQNKIEYIYGLELWNVSACKDMGAMFQCCVKLKKLNLSSWKPVLSSVAQICCECWSLSECHMENFDVHNCTNFSQIFCGVAGVSSLDLSNWDLHNASGSSLAWCGMWEAFDLENYPYAKKITSIKLTHPNNTRLNVSGAAASLQLCFAHHSSLQRIYVPPNSNWFNGSSEATCFAYCSGNLVGNNGSTWNNAKTGSAYAKTFDDGLFTGSSSVTLPAVNQKSEKVNDAPIETSEKKAKAIYEGDTLKFVYDNLDYSQTAYLLDDTLIDKLQTKVEFNSKENNSEISNFDSKSIDPQISESLKTEAKGANDEVWGWHKHSQQVQTIIFDDSFKEYKPKTTSCWFKDFKMLKNVQNINNINIELLKDCQKMFYGCDNLENIFSQTKIDWLKDNKGLISDDMFWGCKNLSKYEQNRLDATAANTDWYFTLATTQEAGKDEGINKHNKTDTDTDIRQESNTDNILNKDDSQEHYNQDKSG